MSNRKNKGTAVFLSIILSGLGQMYAGKVGRGILILFLQLFLVFRLGGGWIFIAIITYIWQLYDAAKSVEEYNDRAERKRSERYTNIKEKKTMSASTIAIIVVGSIVILAALIITWGGSFVENNKNQIDTEDIISKGKVESKEDEGIEIARLELKYYDKDGNEINPNELFDNKSEDLPNIPEPKEEDWYEVETFSGSGPKTTAPFQINSKRWRYTLTCKGLSEDVDGMYNMQINKLIANEPSQVDFKIMSICKEENDPNYVYEGEGKYFVEFTPANIRSWEIKVEAIKKP